MYHTHRGKGFFLPWLTFHLCAEKIGFRLRAYLEKKNWIFGLYSMFLCLSEGVNLLREDWFFAEAKG